MVPFDESVQELTLDRPGGPSLPGLRPAPAAPADERDA
ncbi:MAG: hypothetical protein JWM31_2352, partial [Solirubrobacterales bacterium]|nr:hypothetical protein [Solirubrobacterales bacterium]